VGTGSGSVARTQWRGRRSADYPGLARNLKEVSCEDQSHAKSKPKAQKTAEVPPQKRPSVAPIDLSAPTNLINGLWRKTVQGFVEIGRELNKVQEILDDGTFTKWVEAGELPFKTLRTAERLMAIAANPVLADPTYVSCLPAEWGTLYELSRLREAALLKAIEDGTVTARTERKDVEKLRPKKEKKEPRPLGLAGRRAQAGKRLSAVLTAVHALAKVELDLTVPEFSQRPRWVDLVGSAVLTLKRVRDRLDELGGAPEEAKAVPPRPPAFTMDTLPVPCKRSSDTRTSRPRPATRIWIPPL
jgi:hypothetical protein